MAKRAAPSSKSKQDKTSKNAKRPKVTPNPKSKKSQDDDESKENMNIKNKINNVAPTNVDLDAPRRSTRRVVPTASTPKYAESDLDGDDNSSLSSLLGGDSDHDQRDKNKDHKKIESKGNGKKNGKKSKKTAIVTAESIKSPPSSPLRRSKRAVAQRIEITPYKESSVSSTEGVGGIIGNNDSDDSDRDIEAVIKQKYSIPSTPPSSEMRRRRRHLNMLEEEEEFMNNDWRTSSAIDY